jgi:hypothetical protein
MASRVVIAAGQTFVMEATFTDADTGVLTDPTAVSFVVTYTDWGGRYYSLTYPWAGVDTPNVAKESTGVFRGIYPIGSAVTEFTAKMTGTGAVVGASEELRVLVIP